MHALSEEVRAQTALDYLRTAPAAYSVLKAQLDLTPYLASIAAPTLVVWGERDRTLAPKSFTELVRRLPHAIGKSSPTSHIPHQAEAEWFNELVLSFLEIPPLGRLRSPYARLKIRGFLREQRRLPLEPCIWMC